MTETPLENGTSHCGLWFSAPAKINLNLLVGPVRDDGFHPIDSVAAKVSLFDRISVTPRNDDKITCEVTGDINCGPVEKNLAYRAAVLFQQTVPCSGVDINIHKKIPTGGGLGGGSSDCATVLMAMNDLFGSKMSRDSLAELGSQLGSDVPLFCYPGACRMTGRGESITPLNVSPFHVVLMLPGFPCPTGDVYCSYDQNPQPIDGQLDEDIWQSPCSLWEMLLVNYLEEGAFRLAPELGLLQSRIKVATDQRIHMSGSGSTLFAVFETKESADSFAQQVIHEFNMPCEVASSI